MRKVLIFSHNPLSETSNNGKTLESLFSMFPSSKLCQIYIDQTEYPSFNVCTNFFLLSDKDIIKNIFSYKKSYDAGKTISIKNDKVNKTKSGKLPTIFKSELFKILRNFIWNISKWHSNKLHIWIKEQSPDVIFFVGGNYIFSHKIARKISTTYNLPLISYFTDDYILGKKRSILDTIYKPYLIRHYKDTIKKSSLCYAIGKLMSKQYTIYFKKDFHYLMNCVDIIPFQLPSNSGQVVISYFGGLHLNRWKSLIKFANLLNRKNISVSYIIQAYTFTELSKSVLKKFNDENIVIKNPISGDDLQKAINASHFLLHIESFEKKYIELTRYSISTKIPEYLISSRMIIGYGPSELASMKLLSENAIGIVLDDNSEKFNENMNNLLQYISNINTSHEIIEKGYKYAIDNYSKVSISRMLLNSINSYDYFQK